MSKEVLSPINLLVISFSVINYVVRVRVHARCVDAHFFVYAPSLDMSGRFDRLSDRDKLSARISLFLSVRVKFFLRLVERLEERVVGPLVGDCGAMTVAR